MYAFIILGAACEKSQLEHPSSYAGDVHIFIILATACENRSENTHHDMLVICLFLLF